MCLERCVKYESTSSTESSKGASNARECASPKRLRRSAHDIAILRRVMRELASRAQEIAFEL